MKKLFNILKEKLAPPSSKLQSLKSILPQKKPHSEKYYKRIAFLNKYSLIFHFLLASSFANCMLPAHYDCLLLGLVSMITTKAL